MKKDVRLRFSLLAQDRSALHDKAEVLAGRDVFERIVWE
jgi:hypothetical protein